MSRPNDVDRPGSAHTYRHVGQDKAATLAADVFKSMIGVRSD
jgi:hypothetical protein